MALNADFVECGKLHIFAAYNKKINNMEQFKISKQTAEVLNALVLSMKSHEAMCRYRDIIDAGDNVPNIDAYRTLEDGLLKTLCESIVDNLGQVDNKFSVI